MAIPTPCLRAGSVMRHGIPRTQEREPTLRSTPVSPHVARAELLRAAAEQAAEQAADHLLRVGVREQAAQHPAEVAAG